MSGGKGSGAEWAEMAAVPAKATRSGAMKDFLCTLRGSPDSLVWETGAGGHKEWGGVGMIAALMPLELVIEERNGLARVVVLGDFVADLSVRV